MGEWCVTTPTANERHVVTGAFGCSGKYIARRLRDQGKRVRTLTSSPQRRNPFGSLVEAHPFIGVSASVGLLVARVVAHLMKDVVITREEIERLMANLLVTSSPSAGRTRFTEWVRQNAEHLGRRYSSELTRRHNRERSYEE